MDNHDMEFQEDELQAVEDERDLPTIKARLRRFEETGEAIPWEKAKAELGL